VAHVGDLGWILDPDRKKMSKSKGNVVTPMHLLDSTAPTACATGRSARGSGDTAFDEKVLKVGKRLVTKLFNAASSCCPRRPERPRHASSTAPFWPPRARLVERRPAFEELRVRGGLSDT
jgi:valyl-tRNA synthetase